MTAFLSIAGPIAAGLVLACALGWLHAWAEARWPDQPEDEKPEIVTRILSAKPGPDRVRRVVEG